MSNQKLHEANLRFKYKRRLELSFVFSLTIITLIFYSFAEIDSEPTPIPKIELDDMIVVDVVRTVQHKKPLRPSRPVEALENDDVEMLSEYELIKLFEPDYSDEFAPPENDVEDVYVLWDVSVKPVLLYQQKPTYPDIARRVGLEGTVVVTVLISKKGDVLSASLVTPESMLSDAAIAVAMKCTFKPARQFDRPVKVKMNIPFVFRLR